MGAAKSKTDSPIEIANSVMTDISTKVITNKSTSVSGLNKLNVYCDKEYADKVATLCAEQEAARDKLGFDLFNLVFKETKDSDKATASMNAIKGTIPPVCTKCSASDINMTDTRTITINDSTNNDIVNKMQAELKNQIQAEIDQQTKGGIGLTTSQVNAAQNLSTKVSTIISTEVVNNTMNSFNAVNEINAVNSEVSNISLTNSSTILANSIVANAMSNDASIQTDIETLLKLKQTTTGINPLADFANLIKGIFSGVLAYVVAGIIGFVLILGGIALVISKAGKAATSVAEAAVPLMEQQGMQGQWVGPPA